MSDFEDALRRALAEGAEGAPPVADVAAGARRRRDRRRRRGIAAGAVAAAAAVVLPVALVTGGPDAKDDQPAPPPASPGPASDPMVTCGRASWPVPAMEDGIETRRSEDEVQEALADLVRAAGPDAPAVIRENGPEDAAYVVLAETVDEVTIGVGTWSVDGPGADAEEVVLDVTPDGLVASMWGGCDLVAARADGAAPVEVTAPRGGVDGTTDRPVVLAAETDCTGGRDPEPFLRDPQVSETSDRVLVTLSSSPPDGAVTCVGNPSAPVVLELDAPLGDRELYDAGTWPPTLIETTRDDGLVPISVNGVSARVPADWSDAGCPQPLAQFTESGECAFQDGPGLRFLFAETFEAADPPGVIGQTEGLFRGYVYAGTRWVVFVTTRDRASTRRILGSVADE